MRGMKDGKHPPVQPACMSFKGGRRILCIVGQSCWIFRLLPQNIDRKYLNCSIYGTATAQVWFYAPPKKPRTRGRVAAIRYPPQQTYMWTVHRLYIYRFRMYIYRFRKAHLLPYCSRVARVQGLKAEVPNSDVSSTRSTCASAEHCDQCTWAHTDMW